MNLDKSNKINSSKTIKIINKNVCLDKFLFVILNGSSLLLNKSFIFSFSKYNFEIKKKIKGTVIKEINLTVSFKGLCLMSKYSSPGIFKFSLKGNLM